MKNKILKGNEVAKALLELTNNYQKKSLLKHLEGIEKNAKIVFENSKDPRNQDANEILKVIHSAKISLKSKYGDSGFDIANLYGAIKRSNNRLTKTHIKNGFKYLEWKSLGAKAREGTRTPINEALRRLCFKKKKFDWPTISKILERDAKSKCGYDEDMEELRQKRNKPIKIKIEEFDRKNKLINYKINNKIERTLTFRTAQNSLSRFKKEYVESNTK